MATGAGRVVYGEDLWSPLELIAKWEGSGGRFLGFVCSALWILAQICCNISANSYSFANDVTTLLPKWINIKRGTVLCSLIGGWALVPWLMVSSAMVFLNFMSGYAVFLAPIAGIFCCDYWLVRKRKLDLAGLYDPHGRYRYRVRTQALQDAMNAANSRVVWNKLARRRHNGCYHNATSARPGLRSIAYHCSCRQRPHQPLQHQLALRFSRIRLDVLVIEHHLASNKLPG